MAAAAPPVPISRTSAFIVGIFVISSVIGAIVLYAGASGAWGGEIPGTYHGAPPGPPHPLTSCEGKDRKGTFSFSFVGGVGGGYNFNGTHPGPCVAVVVGSTITVNFSVAADAGTTHTWVLVNAANASTALATPVFPGAGFTGASRFMGIGPSAYMVFHFNATAAGSYQYICEMTGHYAGGMWGWFNVTALPASTTAVPLTSEPSPTPAMRTN